MRLARLSVQSLRTRLACFFAALIAVVLLGFAGAVYLAAAVLEEREVEPQAEKDRELREVRRVLWLSLGMGVAPAVAKPKLPVVAKPLPVGVGPAMASPLAPPRVRRDRPPETSETAPTRGPTPACAGTSRVGTA